MKHYKRRWLGRGKDRRSAANEFERALARSNTVLERKLREKQNYCEEHRK